MRVLGIETSCDETGIAIYDEREGLLAHELYTQASLHKEYGGVVPELASRDHVRKILPLIRQVMQQANSTRKDIDGIAYTAGPGLAGALLVGATVGKSLAWGWDIPCVAVHHMEGHLLAPMLEENPPEFPFVALLVSGGHTLLVRVADWGHYHILGESVDDAAGEAFDKTAKLLGLGYPGGAALAALAEQGDTSRFHFPRPMTDRPGLNFSFSGLKTFAINTLNTTMANSLDAAQQLRADIACAFQQAVVDTLVIKCKRALQQTRLNRLVVAGGVGANQQLRKALNALSIELSGQVFYPRLEFCTDNGAMIAYAGFQRLRLGECDRDLRIVIKPRWPISELSC